MDEWWKRWGIIMFAAKVGKCGIARLYNKSQKILDPVPNINLINVMSMYSMEQLMKNIHFTFHFRVDDLTELWNPVIALIN